MFFIYLSHTNYHTPQMLKAIIIDDEQDAIDMLLGELKNHCPDIEVVYTCNSGIDGAKSIHQYKPDVIFLDIDMPGMNGFEMLEVIGNIDFGVIFTTAFNQYAIQAIRISAIDYLLKPIDETELIKAVERLKKYNQTEQNQRYETLLHNIDPKNKRKKIVFSTQSSHEFINSEDIIYCEADGNYTNVYLINNKKRTYSGLLKKTQKSLENFHFFRIHHKYLVNLDHVNEYIKQENSVKMSNEMTLPVSRHNKEKLLRLML